MEIQRGLRPLPPDPRDGMLGELVVFPTLDQLPQSFSLGEPLWIGDQNGAGESDFCTAYASCGVSQFQESVTLFPAFTFACTKAITGDVTGWGADLRSAMKAHQKYGAVSLSEVTEKDKTLTPDERRDLKNYSMDAMAHAPTHAKRAYVQTKGPYDAYDNIRSALWMYREEKRAVMIGVKWGWNLTDYILSGVPDGFGHAMYAYGWNENGLMVANSAGLSTGKNGVHLITRETINAFIPIFGAYMFIDLSPDEVKKKLERNVGLLEQIVNLLLQALGLKKKMDEIPEPVVEVPKEPEKPVGLLWDTPENVRHSVRVICDEEGLTVEQKNTLCATIQCESQFNTKAVNENRGADGRLYSTDYGLCQWNDYYHGKEITPEESLNNPEKAVRLMCKYWKLNKRNLWVCYSKGMYQKYL